MSNKLFESGHSFCADKYSKSRVELHLHLEGSVRVQTIYELAQAKQYKLTENNLLDEIEKAVTVDNPIDLAHLLAKIDLYIPLFVGDLEAIERIAYELCEDQAAQHVIYFETRFSPHLLSNTIAQFFVEHPVALDSPGAVTPDDAVRAVGRGLKRGEAEFGLQARMILCTIKGQNGWSSDVVRMAAAYASEGVVAIDIAGDESMYSEEEKAAFDKAKELNIHRTVHAGEMGPATNVKYAVKRLHAERIGHGYHVVQDRAIYDMCRKKDIHFETCPYSSYLTGAVSPNEKHAILTFAEDNVNFSISKDDSTQTKSTLDKEYDLLRQQGLNELHLVRANLNAARSCFLPDSEKQFLIDRLNKLYGLVH